MAKDYLTEKVVADRATILFPDKIVFSKADVARILGVSPSTVYHDKKRFHRKRWTIPDIVGVMR